VAELLWGGALVRDARWPPFAPDLAARELQPLLPADEPPLQVLSLLLPALAVHDRRGEGEERERARRLLRQLAASLAVRDERRWQEALGEPALAGAVQVALGAPAGPAVAEALNAALVLVADHDLNTSSFAARVAASAGADLHACLGAALAALSGPRHGGACDRVEALVEEAARASRPAQAVRQRLHRGEALPGFGQPLYRGGDPRTVPLLRAAEAIAGRHGRLRILLELIEAAAELARLRPSVDTGLLALALALELPPGAAAGLLAIGRSAGWVAHVIEQRASGVLLRPRGRYTGPLPG
jgi:citrate synthase